MCSGGSLVERPFTVEGMDKDLGAAQSNAACAIDKFQESGLDVIFESLNPKDFSIPLDNPHLYFFGVHKEQYMKQVGSDPPTGWKEEVRHLIRLIKENLKYEFILQDFILDEEDPIIQALLDYHRKQALIPESERRANKVTKRRRVSKSGKTGEQEDSGQDEEDGQGPNGEGDAEFLSHGEKWIPRAKKLASNPPKQSDAYEWLHPTVNPYHKKYSDADCTFMSFSYREKDVVLHNDRVRPLRSVVDEFLDVYAWPTRHGYLLLTCGRDCHSLLH